MCCAENTCLVYPLCSIIDITIFLYLSSCSSSDKMRVLFRPFKWVTSFADIRLLLTLHSRQNSCASGLHKISTLQSPAAGKCSNHSQGDGNMPLGAAQRKTLMCSQIQCSCVWFQSSGTDTFISIAQNCYVRTVCSSIVWCNALKCFLYQFI